MGTEKIIQFGWFPMERSPPCSASEPPGQGLETHFLAISRFFSIEVTLASLSLFPNAYQY
jgi:hypothetical protein